MRASNVHTSFAKRYLNSGSRQLARNQLEAMGDRRHITHMQLLLYLRWTLASVRSVGIWALKIFFNTDVRLHLEPVTDILANCESRKS